MRLLVVLCEQKRRGEHGKLAEVKLETLGKLDKQKILKLQLQFRSAKGLCTQKLASGEIVLPVDKVRIECEQFRSVESKLSGHNGHSEMGISDLSGTYICLVDVHNQY